MSEWHTQKGFKTNDNLTYFYRIVLQLKVTVIKYRTSLSAKHEQVLIKVKNLSSKRRM